MQHRLRPELREGQKKKKRTSFPSSFSVMAFKVIARPFLPIAGEERRRNENKNNSCLTIIYLNVIVLMLLKQSKESLHDDLSVVP